MDHGRPPAEKPARHFDLYRSIALTWSSLNPAVKATREAIAGN
jgi:hypothetical protein